MKVCFLIQSLRTGGAERTVAYLANYGVDHGVDVDICIYGDTEIYEIDPRIKVFSIGETQESKNIFKRLPNVFKRRRNFIQYVKENKPDAIFCMLMGPILYTLGLRKNIAILSSERSNPKWLKSKAKRIMRKFLLSKVDGMVFQTNKAQEFYHNLKCMKKVIPNAIGNLDAYRVKAKKEKENKICAVGRLCPEKDYPTMFKAVQIVVEKYPTLKLEIYGKGKLEDDLKAQVNNMGLDKTIIFMGNHKDVLEKISNAKCFVMSSVSEGMPNALMEAMSIGLPCVSTDYGNGIEDIITHNENGIIVEPQNPEKLAEAIIYLLENSEVANRIAVNAQKILQTNSLDEIAIKYYSFIQDVLIVKNKI